MNPQTTCTGRSTFLEDVCECREELQCELFCLPGTISDPINNCRCYSPEEYEKEYAHTKGPDCIGGTEDDFVVTHEKDKFSCTDTEYFDTDACACFSLAQCRKFCPPG